MKRIALIENTVKDILERNKSTRDNDYLLFVELVYELKPELVNGNFKEVFENAEVLGLPNFKSMERARRKLQKVFPKLQGSKQILKARKQEEKEYREYSRKGVV